MKDFKYEIFAVILQIPKMTLISCCSPHAMLHECLVFSVISFRIAFGTKYQLVSSHLFVPESVHNLYKLNKSPIQMKNNKKKMEDR